jgi:hypothetical protein
VGFQPTDRPQGDIENARVVIGAVLLASKSTLSRPPTKERALRKAEEHGTGHRAPGGHRVWVSGQPIADHAK